MTASSSIRPVARRSSRSAFTLIELLLVMMIIAILAAIVVPKFTGQKAKAQINAAKADISTLKTALNTFEITNNRFPTSEEGLNALAVNPGNLPEWSASIEKVPVDPWGHPYIYRCPGANGKDYDLLSSGPDGAEGTADDIDLSK